MQAGASARKARALHRHVVRTLTYVTLDDGNGGIVRNLNHEGIAVQAVARLHPEQQVRMRFELRSPRVRVDAYGQVTWANSSGQCGIRFLELQSESRRKIDEWIFASLLESLAHDEEMRASTSNQGTSNPRTNKAPAERNLLNASITGRSEHKDNRVTDEAYDDFQESNEEKTRHAPWAPWVRLKWTLPLSPEVMGWLLDGLVMFAAFLLFALIFLCAAEEVPQWRSSLIAGVAAAILVAGSYWGLFFLFDEASLGRKLVRKPSEDRKELGSDAQELFR